MKDIRIVPNKNKKGGKRLSSKAYKGISRNMREQPPVLRDKGRDNK